MALANVDPESSRAELGMVAQFLVSRQKPNGSWDYPHRTAGDTSISQYAVLGLWEAENAGATVPGEVWDRAARWFLSTQAPAGSWNYHRDEPGQWPENVSMTAAGVGSLLICQRQLQRYRAMRDANNPLLIPLTAEGAPAPLRRRDPGPSDQRCDQPRDRLAGRQFQPARGDHGAFGVLWPLRDRTRRRPRGARLPGPRRLVRAGPELHPRQSGGRRGLERRSSATI